MAKIGIVYGQNPIITAREILDVRLGNNPSRKKVIVAKKGEDCQRASSPSIN
jgi:hypothetical protein